jgi:hypothetical protein
LKLREQAGNGLEFNVAASMNGNQHSASEESIGVVPEVGTSALASDLSKVMTAPFPGMNMV